MCQRKTKQMREFEPILKANGYREIRSNGSHFYLWEWEESDYSE